MEKNLLSNADTYKIIEILGDMASPYMRVLACHILWNTDISVKDKEKYQSMLSSGDVEMIGLAYAIIKEKYDKR